MDPLAAEAHTDHRLAWLTPRRCRVLMAALLLGGFLAHLHYVLDDCPLGLTGDEAYYWEWSRRLDLSYYSKGPAVAYLIRGSCAVFGDNMPAVRLPAMVLAAGSLLMTWWLTRRLFASHRLALGVVLLSHAVPLMVAGSILMTPDAPMYFCWAAATCLAVPALEGRRWAWMALGTAVGAGFLAKYTMALWPVGLILWMVVDRPSRRWLRTAWPVAALAIAAAVALPVLVWNAGRGWPTLWHVQADTAGPEGGWAGVVGVAEFIGGQAAVMGPVLLVVVAAGVVWAWRRAAMADAQGRALGLFLCMGLPLWVMVLLVSVKTKAQANWPAVAYFTLMIVAGRFLADRMARPESWRRWRWAVWLTAAYGAVAVPLAHDLSVLYGPADRLGIAPRRIDPAAKWRGYEQLADAVRAAMAGRGDVMVMAEDYQTTALLAFHLRQTVPRTYCVGTYGGGKRMSQYDIWPDRALDRAAELGLVGRDGVYVGQMNRRLRRAFESVERLPGVVIRHRGVRVREFDVWLGRGFRGLSRSEGAVRP